MASWISERSRPRARRALAAVTAVALAGAGPALAEPRRSGEAARSAARAKLVEGVDALRRGEPGAALERFQEAYALVPSPKIHYDFGLAYLGLGRRAEALSAFERFLAEAQDAPADKREKAAQQTTALRPQVGALAIAVEGAPDGTAIAVDGREVGRAPLARSVYVDPGPHEIVVRLAGGGAGPGQHIEIGAGASVDVVLRAGGAGPTPPGAVAVGVAPPGTGPSRSPAPASAGRTVDVAAGPSLVRTVPAERQPGVPRTAALSLGAAGIVLIGAGATFGLLAKRESDSLSQDSARGAQSGMATPFDASKESRGTRYETLQVIGLAAGAVSLAAGIVLYATSRGRVTAEPAAGRSLAGSNLWFVF